MNLRKNAVMQLVTKDTLSIYLCEFIVSYHEFIWKCSDA